MAKAMETGPQHIRIGVSKSARTEAARAAAIEKMKREVAESAGRPAAPKVARARSQKVWPGWSRRARSRMVRSFLSLDLSPLLREDGTLSMVTLTLPASWELYAPTGAAWAQLLRKFWQRYDRAFPGWGAALIKSEMQARGAPHAHLLISAPLHLPAHVGRGGGRREVGFIEWVSLTWADIVGAAGDERVAHERAGTQVRPWSWGGSRTPAEAAVRYFCKYAMKAGGAARHYQDEPPSIWKAPGAGLARVWSSRRLVNVATETALSDAEALWAQRILRRWHRTRGETSRAHVARGTKRRSVTRRVRRLQARGGWLAVANAPDLANQIERAARIAAAGNKKGKQR